MPPSDFEVIDVSTWPIASVEPGGRDLKYWLVDPDDNGWLFKPVVLRPDRRQGEDWAEKVSAELAGLLGVPVARVELAIRDGVPGSISRDLKPTHAWELHSGAVLIGEIDPAYVPGTRERTGHNLDNIEQVLEDYTQPVGFAGPAEFGAFAVFCGYLVFDAWTANRDRHEENWSVVRDPAGALSLSSSYDHGSSLAFGLQDETRERILAGNPGIEHWAARGTAWRFEGGAELTLVELAARALSRAGSGVRDYWLGRLEAVSSEAVEQIIESAPPMSVVTRMFCVRLLEVNRRRVLDGC